MSQAVFSRPHHQRVAVILRGLRADFFKECECYFGGGTAIALRFDEFGESVDIDFLVSNAKGYGQLRGAVQGASRISALFLPGSPVESLQEVRADQYGIRTRVGLLGSSIKFEIVLEGRIEFQSPKAQDSLEGLACLHPVDMIASKLLANSDRWNDSAVFSRDLIDLVMMDPPKSAWKHAYAKALEAYGLSVGRDLQAAIDRIRCREGWFETCAEKLSLSVPKALFFQRLKRLEQRMSILNQSGLQG